MYACAYRQHAATSIYVHVHVDMHDRTASVCIRGCLWALTHLMFLMETRMTPDLKARAVLKMLFLLHF